MMPILFLCKAKRKNRLFEVRPDVNKLEDTEEAQNLFQTSCVDFSCFTHFSPRWDANFIVSLLVITDYCILHQRCINR
jgi:hypothetical protein